uniref:Uncharacterized protein n=1 Tax=Schistocephalus solidus TaxID=70667 RepID=A0A0X3NTQ5_SCHSO
MNYRLSTRECRILGSFLCASFSITFRRPSLEDLIVLVMARCHRRRNMRDRMFVFSPTTACFRELRLITSAISRNLFSCSTIYCFSKAYLQRMHFTDGYFSR